MSGSDQSYVSIGTSTPIFIQSAFAPDPVQVGSEYFSVRIHAAQVAFSGSIWSKVKSVLVSTQVNLHHNVFGERGVRSLQQVRAVKPNVDEQLGLSINLIDLIPAVMTQVTLTIDLHLDKENRIAQLGALINKESFSAALSLAPGSVAIAKTVSSLAEDIIQTFIPAQEQEPVLQFTGDFNLSTADLRAGYYAILGSRDAARPIPSPLPKLEVKEHRLLAGGMPMSGLSYVVLEVRKATVRMRDVGVGTEWDNRLREAEDVAQGLMDDPLSENSARNIAWEKCKALIKEAQTFLRSEPNYLRSEAEKIVKATYLRCRELVMEPVLERSGGSRGKLIGSAWLPNDQADRVFLDIAASEPLDEAVQAYADEVLQARRAMSGWNNA